MGLVFVIGLLALGVWVMVEYARKSRQCFVCAAPLVRVDKLPEAQRTELESLLPVADSELRRVRVCPRCGRIYGGKWFDPHHRRDMDPEDERRMCDCDGTVLRHPSERRQMGEGEAMVWPKDSKEAAWREEIREALLEKGIKSTCLHCGLSLFHVDALYPAPENCVACTSEDKLSLCLVCGRVYQWRRIGDSNYQAFMPIYSRQE
ncbi:MAG: hypothetical protein KAI38_08140 [Candidatus Latescibacteria bacterium]|nr:hypothetical protein [Candidatus Latescibacterota bacterium]